ncbi:MAG: hypothetical protein PHH28_15435 [Desulfuromonadaceae bacterium]|nr:hypothetical protein [Desulfuromonadaceae bacterium]
MNQDSIVVGKGQELVAKLTDQRAIKYLRFGFNTRALQIKTSWFHLNDLLEKDGGSNRNPYEAVQTNIYLNSYYLNLLGAIDNLAWVLQHQFNLIQGATDDNGKRNKIIIFGKDFGAKLNALDSELVREIESYKKWFENVKEFRDPAAHRMPLYCPPGIITDKYIDNYKQASEKHAAQDYSVDSTAFMEAMHEMAMVGEFKPVFVGFTEGDEDVFFPLKKTLIEDYEPFWSLAGTVLAGVERNLTRHSR